jgi:HSP20 family protein
MTKNFLIQWTQMQRKVAAFGDQLPESPFWVPNTDVYDREDVLVVRMELAGVPKETVEVHLDNDTLVVSGVRRDPCSGETAAGYRFRQMEIDYGPFQRAIPLPYPVDGSRAKADCRDGILEIRIPKARTRHAKRIAVNL